MECIEETHAVGAAIKARNFEQALELRGNSFKEGFRILRTLVARIAARTRGRTRAKAVCCAQRGRTCTRHESGRSYCSAARCR